MKIEREIDQIKSEVLKESKFINLFLREYKLKDGGSNFDFPTCKGCGYLLSPNDLLKIFPEKAEEIREVSNLISKRKK